MRVWTFQRSVFPMSQGAFYCSDAARISRSIAYMGFHRQCLGGRYPLSAPSSKFTKRRGYGVTNPLSVYAIAYSIAIETLALA